MNPPKIVNEQPRNCQFGRIPALALPACNIKLTDRERRLLFYYACQRTGFAPAAKTVELYTGIAPKNMYGIRKHLGEMGYIIYEKTSKHANPQITINWEKIIEDSKMLLFSAESISQDPGFDGRIYPREGKKKPSFQTTPLGTKDITYIYPAQTSKSSKTMKSILGSDALSDFHRFGKLPQHYDGYYESGASRIEDLTETELEQWLDTGLPFWNHFPANTTSCCRIIP